MKQWKKFVGYDPWDRSQVGEDSANPGPIDNKSLLAGEGLNVYCCVFVWDCRVCLGGGRSLPVCEPAHVCTVHGLPMLQVCLHLAVYQLPSLQF